MELYKMELRKIWSRKITVISAVILMAVTVISLAGLITDEIVKVEGVTYKGYRAVQKNKEIEEQCGSKLTDKDLNKIFIEMNGQNDQNYLIDFITQWLSNGEIVENDQGGVYKEADKIYPVEETELGKILKEQEMDLTIKYTQGFKTFLTYVQFGMCALSIFLIIALSPVFAEEYQENTAGLIYTSEYGRTKDLAAKAAAVFTVAAGGFLVIVLAGGAVCRLVYGNGDLHTMAGLVIGELRRYSTIDKRSIGQFTAVYLISAFGAVLMLAGMILWMSAHFRKNYHVIIVAVAVWCLPIVIRILIGPGYWMILGETQPAYLIVYRILAETEGIRGLQVVMILAGAVGGGFFGCRKSGQMQKN